MVTKENALQFKEVCQWIADGECQYLNGSRWCDVESFDKLDFTNSIHCYRRRPRKVTRPMTIEEVMALGHFVRKCGGDGRLVTGFSGYPGDPMKCWIGRGDTYSTDGGKSWHLFTVTKEAK